MPSDNIIKRLAALERAKPARAGRVARVIASGHSQDEIDAALCQAGFVTAEEDLVIIRQIVASGNKSVARLRVQPPQVRV